MRKIQKESKSDSSSVHSDRSQEAATKNDNLKDSNDTSGSLLWPDQSLSDSKKNQKRVSFNT